MIKQVERAVSPIAPKTLCDGGLVGFCACLTRFASLPLNLNHPDHFLHVLGECDLGMLAPRGSLL